MKTFFTVAIFCICFASKAQTNTDFKIIDVSQKEIRVFNQYNNLDSTARNKIFVDSLFTPYKHFWSGYLGDEKSFLIWINDDVLPNLVLYNKRNAQINGVKLLQQFSEIKEKMFHLTGYQPKGIWYIVFGPAWSDLGGLGNDGTMFIDLSHEHNTSNENIIMLFPHEITHQISTNVNKHSEKTVLARCIGEGFAVYVNKIYWGNKFTDAQNLGFSETEYLQCESKKSEIRSFFNENIYSENAEIKDNFASRSFHFSKELPGAIGYYIGFKIVENYVAKYGKDSWKDVFKLSPKEVYNLAGF